MGVLSLSGSSSRAAWCCTCSGMSICTAESNLSVHECRNIRNLCILQRPRCLTAGWAFAILSVCSNVEGNEKDKV